MITDNRRHADLHLHSIFSDGLLTPTEVVKYAFQLGVSAIALADHDTVDGIEEAQRAADSHDIEVIPAVELSVAYNKLRDVHLLGYCINHHDKVFLRTMASYRKGREERGRAIVERINQRLERQKKVPISYDEVRSLAEGAVGRPHIARALIARGYATDMENAFVSYLKPCDIAKKYFPMGEAISEIHRLGGVAVLAHPFCISPDRQHLKQVIQEMIPLGLDGIEAYTPGLLPEDIDFLRTLAMNEDLVITGGSDFHGPINDRASAIDSGGFTITRHYAGMLHQRDSFLKAMRHTSVLS